MSQIPTFNLAHTTEGNYAIQQGITFQGIAFYYKNVDLTSYTVSGQIRSNYAANRGILLAEFEFEPLVYGNVSIGDTNFDATIVTPKLSSTVTAAIPTTVPMSQLLAGISGWVYDIKLTAPDMTIINVVRGLVQVQPDVTRAYTPSVPVISNPLPSNPSNPCMPGTATLTASYPVAAPIAAYQVVALSGTGIIPASVGDVTQSNQVVGIALSAGTVGQTIQVATQGQVIYSGWAFNRSKPVFVGLNGAIVQDDLEPADGATFSKRIGSVSRPNTINISLAQSLLY